MTSYELEELESDESGISLFALAGELDLTNANELAEQLDKLGDTNAPLVLDLNRVVFIDSAALHCLFRIARTRGRQRLAFVVEQGAPIATTLAIVELGRAAIVTPTLDDARAALASRGR